MDEAERTEIADRMSTLVANQIEEVIAPRLAALRPEDRAHVVKKAAQASATISSVYADEMMLLAKVLREKAA